MTGHDAELIRGICQRDRQSFENFYKLYYRKLYMLAYQYVRNQEQAEEIVHDIFLKFWDGALELNIKQSLGSYLSRSVINTALNTLKKEKRMAVHVEKYTAGFDESEEISDDATILENKLLCLEAAIKTLPPQCKKVLMMSKFEKCKQQEIADTLNISIKTVKNHLTIGYERIRNLMSGEELLLFIFVYLNCFY
ncbi:RNA polymerase sigma-70 factor [Pedobacter sp. N36a]|uniref:RNA polymerase sigma factor n=1 Tax=Pedobacter sp. N36a TaxID=2767996 RepID=UPI001656DC05|nr:RNA polymerase sigma-70 factor [Pedobacter sp. N36a]MBC8986815.1 RNA polymerase sigma-70 factor [Pedobacter sp. N36a]